MEFKHTSVLLDEVIENLNIKPDGIYLDGTLGGGGHSYHIAERLTQGGRLIGTDQDADAIAAATKRLEPFADRVTIIRDNYENAARRVRELGIDGVDGILLDLGVSSYQLDNPDRGFSFAKSGPLDMRMNPDDGETAADLVNNLPKEELEKIIYEFGEERFGRKIAEAIVKYREAKPFETTDELAKVICDVVPSVPRNQKHIHPATRTFQALRIAVNHELDEISDFLNICLDCLNSGGHLTIISFHSLEDRLVKNFIQKNSKGCECPPQFPVCVCGKKPRIKVLTKKAVFAEEDEVKLNPRARSARLRSVVKI